MTMISLTAGAAPLPEQGFEENRGQASIGAPYLLRASGYVAALSAQAYTVKSATAPAFTVRMVGANPTAALTGEEPRVQRSHYLLGTDTRQWQAGVRHFRLLRAAAVYPGIDVVYRNPAGRLRLDFELAPGAALEQIRLDFGAADGVRLDAQGNLLIAQAGAQFLQRAPTLYQEREGRRLPVDGGYRLLGSSQIGFRVGRYDPERPLIIDPEIEYATYLGGGAEDEFAAMVRDASGNIYLAGTTASLDFPTEGSLDRSPNGARDVFIAKLNSAGDGLLYATYYGGSGDDEARALAVDANGNAYVAGRTASPNLPLENSLQASLRGVRDAFVMSLNATGDRLRYATYFGGNGDDEARAMVLDAANAVTVAGTTTSTDLPVERAFQTTNRGGSDAFIARLTPAGDDLGYASYLGGSGNDEATALLQNGLGSYWIAGATSSSNFPTESAFQRALAGGVDGFVAKLNPMGDALEFASYLGGRGDDRVQAAVLEITGGVTVVGETASIDFPLEEDPFQSTLRGPRDAFIARFDDPAGDLIYSSYFGGNGDERALAVTRDAGGRTLLVGETTSSDLPVEDAIQNTARGGRDGFIAVLNAAVDEVVFASYLGGSADDGLSALTAVGTDILMVAGATRSTNLPLEDAFQQRIAGGGELYLARLSLNKESAGEGEDDDDGLFGCVFRRDDNAALDPTFAVALVGLYGLRRRRGS